MSMVSLYLPLTYSGLVTTMRAMRPPSGVMPLRSPTAESQSRSTEALFLVHLLPRTLVSM